MNGNMRHQEYQYLDLLREIMENGHEKRDFATGKILKSLFFRTSRYDLSEDFPLLTTKKVYFKGVVHELLWFLKGDTNIKSLVDNDVHIWDEWPYKNYLQAMKRGDAESLTQEEFVQKIRESAANSEFVNRWGDCGPIYGKMWRKWPASDGRAIDQLKWALWKTKNYPERKHAIVSAWNPEFIYEMATKGAEMAIPPCHTLYGFNVNDKKLSLFLLQRSCDMFLGVPFNIASYALFTKMSAQICGYEPGEFVHAYVDAHIYGDHYDQVNEQLSRVPRPFPKLIINPEKKSIDDFTYDDFKLVEYNPHSTIKAPITPVGGMNEYDRERYKID